jgi:hypothetical protein
LGGQVLAAKIETLAGHKKKRDRGRTGLFHQIRAMIPFPVISVTEPDFAELALRAPYILKFQLNFGHFYCCFGYLEKNSLGIQLHL